MTYIIIPVYNFVIMNEVKNLKPPISLHFVNKKTFFQKSVKFWGKDAIMFNENKKKEKAKNKKIKNKKNCTDAHFLNFKVRPRRKEPPCRLK